MRLEILPRRLPVARCGGRLGSRGYRLSHPRRGFGKLLGLEKAGFQFALGCGFPFRFSLLPGERALFFDRFLNPDTGSLPSQRSGRRKIPILGAV